MRKFIMGAALAAMVAGSSVAQAAPIANVRSDSPVAASEGVSGTELAVLGVALLLLILAGFGINDNDKDDGFPVSA